MFAREEIEHAFAHQAAQVEGIAGAARADQQPHLDRTLAGLGHLGHADPAIPQRFTAADPLQLGADRCDRRPVVQPQEGRAKQVGTASRPILERMRTTT
ncbi:hypothetical protein G6F32_015838 [Rhizopus arrhizus]|nr:hypothetical protein G6F32_015838 [Rhizopus arrhizus]